jgi:hypothetical protein
MMREELKKEAIALLENYLADFEYWCGDMEVDGINYVTSGTPYFETLEDANAYRVMVKAVLKEFKDA